MPWRSNSTTKLRCGSGNAVDQAMQSIGELASLVMPGGIALVGGLRPACVLPGHEPALFAQHVETRISRHFEQPLARAGDRIVALPVAHECLLRDIFGLTVAAQQRAGEPVHGTVMLQYHQSKLPRGHLRPLPRGRFCR